MPVSIEHASSDDIETLIQIQIAAFHHDTVLYGVEHGGPPGYDSVESAREKMHDDIYYKILLDGEIVGGIVVMEMEQGHLHLDLIYVDPQQHDKGIGTQAMTLLEAAHPAEKWTLDTPTYAVRNQHFYEKLGYVKVRAYEEDGFGLIAYEKRTD